MAKKNNKKENQKEKKGEQTKIKRLKDETTSWIFAIIFFAFFVILLLARFEMAGGVNAVYRVLEKFFGWGYILLPILSLLLSISFAKSIKHPFETTRAVGSGLFFLASLALLDLAFPEKGGQVGHFIQKPLMKLFGYGTPVILGALIIISILIIFDTAINFSSLTNIFRRKKDGEEKDEEEISEKEVTIIDSNDTQKEIKATPTTTPIIKKPTTEEYDEFKIKTNILSKPFNPPRFHFWKR